VFRPERTLSRRSSLSLRPVHTGRVRCDTGRVRVERPVQTQFSELSEFGSGAHRTRPVCAFGVATGVGSSLRRSLSLGPVHTRRVRCDTGRVQYFQKRESGALSVLRATASFLTVKSTGRWSGQYQTRPV